MSPCVQPASASRRRDTSKVAATQVGLTPSIRLTGCSGVTQASIALSDRDQHTACCGNEHDDPRRQLPSHKQHEAG